MGGWEGGNGALAKVQMLLQADSHTPNQGQMLLQADTHTHKQGQMLADRTGLWGERNHQLSLAGTNATAKVREVCVCVCVSAGGVCVCVCGRVVCVAYREGVRAKSKQDTKWRTESGEF